MSIRSLLFRGFLALYLLLLLTHIAHEAGGMDSASIAVFGLGIASAVYAHTRTGILLYLLLVVHMSMEWAGYASTGFSREQTTFALEWVHIVFDVTFLGVVAKSLWKNTYVFGVIATLGGIALIATNSGITHIEHGHHGHLLEFLVLGGILGCTAYHIVKRA